MKNKHLSAEGKGEMDYDYSNDILFFKIKNREYKKSIELDDLILDIDNEGFVTGLQIFGASKMLRIEKDSLRNVKKWSFEINVEENIITIHLFFEAMKKNKIVEMGQNIIRESTSPLSNSQVSCGVEI